MMIRNAIATLTFLSLSGAAFAQANDEVRRPVLKAEATITGEIVRIGDLVENAGMIARVPIFRAPDLGFTGSVPASTVVEAVRQHQLIDLDTAGIASVTVTRPARVIPASDVEAAVAQALSAQYTMGPARDITVTFERDMRALNVEPSATGDLRIAALTYDARTSRFNATLSVPTGASANGTLRLAGRAIATAEVVIIARAVERGMVLKDGDVAIERRPRAEVGRDVIINRDAALGMAARSPMQAGRVLRTVDLAKPELVQRNDFVTLVFEAPGITLTVRGKSLEAGAMGDNVSVVNEQSKRSVQGTIIGQGRVLVSNGGTRVMPAPQMAAAQLPVQMPAQPQTQVTAPQTDLLETDQTTR